MKKVSVIVPIYNISDCIKYCISSLVKQNYENLEIILVDDGSTDKSPQICDEYSLKYGNVRVIHKHNGGLSSARNAGLDVISGEYVMFVDGDDYIQNGTISSLIHIAQQTGVDVIQFGYDEVYGYGGYTDAKHPIVNPSSPMDIETSRYRFFENLYKLGGVAASACTKFIKSDIAKSLRFKEDILHEDEEFTTRLFTVCNSIGYLNGFKPYKYVMREGSIINTSYNPKRVRDLSAILDERIVVLGRLGYRDLIDITASKYFANLILFYEIAIKNNDKNLCLYIDSKAKYLISNYKLKLSNINRTISILYQLGLPGSLLFYKFKSVVCK